MSFFMLTVYVFGLLRVALGWNNVSQFQVRDLAARDDLILVAFIAPFTESSRFLEREWDLASAQLGNRLLAIDCTIERNFCAQNDIASVPAIRLFKGDKNLTRYRGPRKASEIISFAHRSSNPALSSVNSDNISEFISTDKHIFVAYLDPQETQLASIVESVARRNHHKFTFGVATDLQLAKAQGAHSPMIIAYHESGEEQERFTSEWHLKAVEAFIDRTTSPLIGDLTRRNELKYLKSGKSLLYIFAETSEERINYQSSFTPLAKKYREYINFVTIDATEDAHLAPGLGLVTGNFPAVALQNPMFGQVFPYAAGKGASVEGVEKWILDIVAGKVEPWAEKRTQNNEAVARDEL